MSFFQFHVRWLLYFAFKRQQTSKRAFINRFSNCQSRLLFLDFRSYFQRYYCNNRTQIRTRLQFYIFLFFSHRCHSQGFFFRFSNEVYLKLICLCLNIFIMLLCFSWFGFNDLLKWPASLWFLKLIITAWTYANITKHFISIHFCFKFLK